MGDAQRHHRGAHRVDRGGIAGLVAFLREHGGAVEADLLRFYRADIRDLGSRRLSWRRLAVLIGNLPADSSLLRSMGHWTPSETLLSHIENRVAVANWQRGGGKDSRGRKVPPPEPIRPPAVLRAEQRKRDELRARLEAMPRPHEREAPHGS